MNENDNNLRMRFPCLFSPLRSPSLSDYRFEAVIVVCMGFFFYLGRPWSSLCPCRRAEVSSSPVPLQFCWLSGSRNDRRKVVANEGVPGEEQQRWQEEEYDESNHTLARK